MSISPIQARNNDNPQQLYNVDALASPEYRHLLVNPLRAQTLIEKAEETLLEHNLIRSCTALFDHRLAKPVFTIYFTAYANKPVSGQSLYQYLVDRIPHYVYPTYFIQIEDLPMTSEGGVDYESLPLPDEGELLNSEVFIEQQQSLPPSWTEASNIHQQNVENLIRQAEGKFATQAIPYIAPSNDNAGPGAQMKQHPLLSESPLHSGDATRVNSMPTNTEEGRNELANSLTHQNQQKLNLTNSSMPTPSPLPK